MKYTEAWSEMAKQNLNLKILITFIILVSLCLSITTIKLSFKDAIIIDRGCFSSKLTDTKKQVATKSEIESFLALAIAQRFDTSLNSVDWMISNDELKLREIEQKELQSKNLKQRVLVSSVTETTEGFKLETDRIISVGDIRSAFKFSLIVQIESTNRSAANPYGLILVSTKLVASKNLDELSKSGSK